MGEKVMKAINVRKGNILECGGSVVELNDIGTAYHTHINLELEWRSVSRKTKVKEYSPILMNEDWHNNFGVEQNGFMSFEYVIPRKQNMGITVSFSGDYVFLRQKNDDKPSNDSLISIWNNDLMRRGMYIHEWQNLYHSISGSQELKIAKKI